ncbi:MAG: hypothetical protein EXR08_07290 [Alphaproteobacteria bacterium]|nr:hypothetical protein [Alphaproteobacteria bacterium]
MLRYVAGLCFLLMVCGSGAPNARILKQNQAAADGAEWLTADLTQNGAGKNPDLTIIAKNIKNETASTAAVGWTREGVGAAGAQASAPAIKAETGFDPVRQRSEQIIFEFSRPVAEANIDVAYFFRGEGEWNGVRYHEQGGWRAYRENLLIEEGRFVPQTAGGDHKIIIKAQAAFDRLEMFATPYVTDTGVEIAPGAITMDSSDFLVRKISYERASETQMARAP